MHEIEQVNVKRFFAEVLTDHLKNCAFQKEGIVHGHKTNSLYAVPARLATTGNASVHYIVCYKEIGLELERTMKLDNWGKSGEKTHPFNRPPEDGCLEVFLLGQLATFEDGDRVDDTQPSVEFTTWDVVVHTLLGD